MSFDFSIQTAQAFVAINNLVLGIGFLVLWRAAPEERAPAIWGIAGLCSALRYALLILGFDYLSWPAFVIDALAVATVGGIVIGTLAFLRHPIPWRGTMAVGALGFCILASLRAAPIPDTWHFAAIAVVSSGAFSLVSLTFLAAWRRDRNLHNASIAAFAAASAVLWLLQPIFRDDQAVATAVLFARAFCILALVVSLMLAVQRRLTDRIRNSERRFRIVLDHMPLAVFLKSGDRYVVANRTYADWLGLSSDQIEKMTDVDLYRRMNWTEEERADALSSQEKVMQTGQTTTAERAYVMANGQTRNFVISKFPVTGPSGEVVAVGTAAIDVTELRRMENSLVQSQKMEALGRLAGGIAHDFNNIVGAIAGFARFIVEDNPPATSNRNHAERILTAAGRAKQIITQILTFTRRGDVVRQRVAVAPIMDEVAGLVRATLPSSTELERDGAWPDATLTANAAQIVQVLVNLIVNANDAIGGHPGHIKLTAQTDTGDRLAASLVQPESIIECPDGSLRHIVGTIDPRRNYVRLAVRDDGSGMSRPILEKLFEPFFTTKPKGHGTGLGLPVVHGIVLGHGGVIVVTTRPGAGSTVEIILPQDGSPAAPGPVTADTSAPAGQGRVLVIDDDDDFGDMVAIALERLGYEAAIVNDSVAALAVFEEDPGAWDLVITDYTMPGRSGLELIHAVKQSRAALPCVLCTGSGHPGIERAAEEVGADAFLAKPVDPIVMAEVVARLIRRTRPAQTVASDGFSARRG
jgi:two-component system, cell cycle sensor histidine kinase and response regulator CckA